MSILFNRNFLILYLGQMVSTIGNNIYMITLPWYILSVTGSRTDLTYAGLAQTLPALFGLLIGVFIDRWRKKRTMVISDALRGLISFVIFLFAELNPHPTNSGILILLILVVSLQLVGTVFSPAQMALLPKIVPANQLTQATGLNQSGNAFAQLTGSVGGGVFIGIVGAPLMFLVNALSFLVSVVSLCFIEVRDDVQHAQRTSLFAEWKEGMSLIFAKRGLFRIALSGVVANFVLSPIMIVVAAFVRGPMHGSGWMFGMMSAVDLVGVLIGGAILSKFNDSLSGARILFVGPVVIGLCLWLLGMVPNLYWDTSMMFLSGIAVGCINGSTASVMLQMVPDFMRGRVFSSFSALIRLSSPLGMAVFGFLIIHMKLSIVFAVAGAVVFAAGLLFIKPVRHEGATALSASQGV